MKWIIILMVFIACVPPLKEEPAKTVECHDRSLRKKLKICEERVESLESICNPVFGQWSDCEQWVFDRWYPPGHDCSGDIYPPYSEGYE